MNFAGVIRVGLRTLARNKLRTILTMLAIIIGVMAVICIVGVGTSAREQAQDQIQSLGVNVFFIQAGSVNAGGIQMGTGAGSEKPKANAQIARVSHPGDQGFGCGTSLPGTRRAEDLNRLYSE